MGKSPIVMDKRLLMHRPRLSVQQLLPIGHTLYRQTVEDLADNFVRNVGAQDSARNLSRLDQQQFRLRHFSLQVEPAVSPVLIRSSIRTSRAVNSSDFSGEPTEKFLPMDTSQSHAIVLGGHAK